MLKKYFPTTTYLLALATIIAYIAQGPAADTLVYSRELISQGEHYRWISGHLIHSDISHLMWNLSGLLILGTLIERTIGYRIIPLSIVGMITINLFIHQAPNLLYYCGFSGILNTWLTLLIIQTIQHKPTKLIGILTALGASAKLIVELTAQSAIFTQTAWPSIPEAHLYGALGGLFYWLLTYQKRPQKLITQRVPI